MTPCRRFPKEEDQPFKLHIQYTCLSTINFHAHLSESEIIGLLAGTYDPDTKSNFLNFLRFKKDPNYQKKKAIVVHQAHPARSLGAQQIEVELDPVSEFEIRQKCTAEGLSIVGWYHSHPVFQPDP